MILALAVVGAVVVLRGSKEEPGEPSVALSVFSVRGKFQVIALPKGGSVTLQLPIPAAESSQSFSITAFHGDTETSWVDERVDNEVQTSVETAQLLDGRYDLELRDTGEAVIGYYSFRK
ncbi:MAG: hypothetical protein GY811_18065 [Myxococcales bacterium]|nr:hypothetical protein [Myxococcales bacterium]